MNIELKDILDDIDVLEKSEQNIALKTAIKFLVRENSILRETNKVPVDKAPIKTVKAPSKFIIDDFDKPIIPKSNILPEPDKFD